MKRTNLRSRSLPAYSRGEELVNTLSHGFGSLLGIIVLVFCLLKAAGKSDPWAITGCALYGTTFIIMFTISAVYHGLRPGMGKKVMQVIDHCTIYFLICGTYTPIVLCAIRPVDPVLAWGLLAFEWGLAILAAVFTAIDLHKYSTFSMICYIGMGWAIIPFWQQLLAILGKPGFSLLLAGGIAYTLGSVLYGLGRRRKWMHSAFHLFVLLGAALQAGAIFLYAI